MGRYVLSGDDFHLAITDRWGERFEIMLVDQSKEFTPDISRLESRIIGHFFQVAGVKHLVDGLKRPLNDSILVTLLACYKES